jgi:hypothetical protein
MKPTDPINKPRRLRALGAKIILGMVVVTTAICVFYTFENWRWKRAWESYVAARTAKGLWFDGRVVMPPEHENFAAIPILKSLIGPAPNTNGGPRVLTPEEFIVPSFQLYRTELDWNIIRPFRGERDRCSPIDLVALQTYYRGGTNLPADEIGVPQLVSFIERTVANFTNVTNPFPVSENPQSAAEDVLLALSIYDAELKQMTDALNRPHAQFQTSYGPKIALRHLAMAKGIIFLTRTRATAHLENGSPDLGFAGCAGFVSHQSAIHP